MYFDEEDQAIESVWAATGRPRLPLLIKGSCHGRLPQGHD